MSADVEVLVVTGMSGAGRSTAAKVLEDSGWYVVDNAPTRVVENIVRVTRDEGTESKLGVVLRAVDTNFADELKHLTEDLTSDGVRVKTVFLDARDDMLVRRFEQVRRRHPLQGNGTLVDAITSERTMLAPIAEAADLSIDTTSLPVARLRQILDEAYAQESETALRVVCESFGFKYGLPIDADLVADVRFLPNPFWIPELRDHDGREEPVRDYVLGADGAADYLDTYERIVRLTAAGYRREGKRYMTVAVGCTGGKHRSVAMAEALSARLQEADPGVAQPGNGGPTGDTDSSIDTSALSVRVVHRDLGRE
ncbi:RNase adapter RapZ [Gordonia jinhuaensis]|uniref:Nucleotide-binding protein n=1 Tax=Gordonia jinhuaensis TaxID=1517702 RepID=A0A916T1T4_9ACTN|nr:RNase adapter RapZ [Gordonia jinhuaensis]GGB24995.1 nucleotide-binding protein [Gordonia jinhuaensis]